MNWTQMMQLFAQAPTLGAAMAEMNAWAAPPPIAPAPSPSGASGITYLDGMPLFGPPQTVVSPTIVAYVDGMPLTSPEPPIAAPLYSLPGNMPLSGPPVPTLTDANAPVGAVDIGGGMFTWTGDHGGGGPN